MLVLKLLAAKLTRYHLEVNFRHEAELRGTNPKEIKIKNKISEFWVLQKQEGPKAYHPVQ
jgi:hypothetical protein